MTEHGLVAQKTTEGFVPSWQPRFEDMVADLPHTALNADECMGRVIKLDRGYPLVLLADETLVRAEHAISLVKNHDKRCAVGDWVVITRPKDHDKAVVQRICERRFALTRWDGGNRGSLTGEEQVLAANIDLVFCVYALSKRLIQVNPLLRALIIALDAAMTPVVLLTKADLKRTEQDLKDDIARVARHIGDKISVYALSVSDTASIAEVAHLIAPGKTALVLGASGAGKSTLINALIGEEVLQTGSVRLKDQQGRHTTVSRQLLRLPHGGMVVDAPGLRSIPMVGHEAGLDRLYPEVSHASTQCKFRDCTHEHEPGCALQQGVADGTLDEVRVKDYLELARELRISSELKQRALER